MNRRGYLVTCAALGAGCLGRNAGRESPQPGTVTCAEGLPAAASSGPSGGGWPTLHHDMQNTSAALDQRATVGCPKTRWTWEFSELQTGVFQSPVARGDTVYLGDEGDYPRGHPERGSKLLAFDAATGKRRWRYTQGDRVGGPQATPTIADGVLYLVGWGDLHAISLAERSQRWYRLFFKDVRGANQIHTPRVVEDILYLGIQTGHVKALDVATGKTQWTFEADGIPDTGKPDEVSPEVWDARIRGGIAAPVAVANGTVYSSSWDFNLYALDATSGTEQWRFHVPPTGLPPFKRSRILAPAIDDGWVFAQTGDARVYALDATDGTVRWRFHEHETASNGVSPAVDTDTVYAVAGTSTENLSLYALVKATGEERWRTRISPPESGPCVDATHVYIASGYDFLAIDKQTGDVQWRLPLNGGSYAPPALIDGAVYMVDVTGHLSGVW